MENQLKSKKSFIAARAMRMAGILSIAEWDQRKKWTNNGKYSEKGLFDPPGFDAWPEIDVDTLLPWNEDMYFLSDDGASPAIWPMNYAAALPHENGGVRIFFCKTAEPKKLRGVARRFSAWNVEVGQITIDEHSRVVGVGGSAFGRFGKTWINLVAGGNITQFATGDMQTHAPSIAIGAALRARYEWSAVFSFPTGVRLRFGCSASGALQLFKDRDSPEGERRKALLHWVRRHWRKPSTAMEASEVRKHLRGITKISWRGLDVSIIPSEFEIEEAA